MSGGMSIRAGVELGSDDEVVVREGGDVEDESGDSVLCSCDGVDGFGDWLVFGLLDDAVSSRASVILPLPSVMECGWSDSLVYVGRCVVVSAFKEEGSNGIPCPPFFELDMVLSTPDVESNVISPPSDV